MLKVVLVDDEKSMLIIMKRLLAGMERVEIVGSFQKAANALDFMLHNAVDVAFLDISIAEENGMALARALLELKTETEVVFVTSHREFALEAFDASAFDYLVKPISRERLERTVRRAVERKMRRTEAPAAEETSRLSVRCLGELEVGNNRGGAVKWRSSKCAELFSYLLMQRGRAAAKERLLEEIFHGMPVKNIDIYLNTTVYQIRKALEPLGLKAAVIVENEQYRVDLTGAAADFLDFERAVSDCARIGESNWEEACRAETLFADDLFGSKAYLWSLAERERLSDLHAALAKRLGRWLLENGRAERAGPIVKKLVGRNGLDEEANELVMRYYAASRDRAALARQYERFKTMLDEELGVKPPAEITRLCFSLIDE